MSILSRWLSASLGILLFCSLCSRANAGLVQVSGAKFPNSSTEGLRPVLSSAWVPEDNKDLGGFNELLPYVTPSPHQENAGTCLFMSLTGIAQWWLRHDNNITTFKPDDNFDLSARWWINQSSEKVFIGEIDNWYTDTISMFNKVGAVLNRDYRFTKGWFTGDKYEDIRATTAGAPGATYGTKINWVNQTQGLKLQIIPLPHFEKTILLSNAEKNPWAIGAAPTDIAESVKAALRIYRAPVQVVYNHQGYWHSVAIMGYNDDLSIGECPFIKESLNSFDQDPTTKKQAYKAALRKSLLRTHGCGERGVFYVRDSIYHDPDGALYHYDFSNPAGDKPYSKTIILREYDWLIHLANHITVITASPQTH
jgi:hypothetical protein